MSNNKHTIKTGIKNEHIERDPVFSRTVPVSSRVPTKQFITKFNFAEPDWGSLPPNFLSLPKEGLTREENHLLGAIKLAWKATRPEGMTSLKKAVARTGGITLALLVLGLITFTSLRSSTSPTLVRIREVSAATISATFKSAGTSVSKTTDEIIESTRSAMFKQTSH